jgi:S-adenosylmethionine hydrolase
VFAPAAAYVASGVDPIEMGPSIDPNALVQLEIPRAWVHDDHLHGEVLQVDRFGNLQLNVGREQLEELELSGNGRIEIRLEGHRLAVPLGATFADVDSGQFVLIEDSYRHLSLAINKGDAAAHLRARAGSTAIVGPTTA